MDELYFRMELNSQKQFTVVVLLVILNCSQRRGGHCRKFLEEKLLSWGSNSRPLENQSDALTTPPWSAR